MAAWVWVLVCPLALGAPMRVGSVESSWSAKMDFIYESLGYKKSTRAKKHREGRGVLYSMAGTAEFVRREVLPAVQYLREMHGSKAERTNLPRFALAAEARPLWSRLDAAEKDAILDFFDDILLISIDGSEEEEQKREGAISYVSGGDANAFSSLSAKARVKYLKIVAMASTPFAETVFLDFDSRPCRANFAEALFGELGESDLALTNKFKGQELLGEDHYKFEHNSACVAYRWSPKIDDFFVYYERSFLGLQKKKRSDSTRDQPAMMVALRRAVNFDKLNHKDMDSSVFCRSKISESVSCEAGCSVVHKPQKHDSNLKVFIVGGPATGAAIVARMLDALKIEPRLDAAERLRLRDYVAKQSRFDWPRIVDDVLGPAAEEYRVFYDAPWATEDAYKTLATRFPKAKFILTTRADRETWRHQLETCAANGASKNEILRQEDRNDGVRRFFSEEYSDRFLEIDLTTPSSTRVWSTLCSFVEAWTPCPTSRHIPKPGPVCDNDISVGEPQQIERRKEEDNNGEKKEDPERAPLWDYKQRVAAHLNRTRVATPVPPKVVARPVLSKAQRDLIKKAVPLSDSSPRWHAGCSPVRARGVFYNRIPKSGSASIMSWMSKMLNETAKFRDNLKQTDVTWWTPHVAKHRWLDAQSEATFVETVKGFGERSRFVTQRHVYHTPSLLAQKVAFVNVARDPVDRCVSRYNYEAFYKRRIPAVDFDRCFAENDNCGNFEQWTLAQEQHFYQDYPVPTSAATDLERKQFLQLSHNESMALFLDECHDYMTRWFCGHGPECRDPAKPRLALRVAKQNILNHYAHVGVLEDLPNTVQLFRLRLPDFFEGDPSHTPDEADFPELHSAKLLASKDTKKRQLKSKPLSPQNLEKLFKANQRDLELYHFILDLHRRRVKLCLQTDGATPESSSSSSSSSWPPPVTD